MCILTSVHVSLFPCTVAVISAKTTKEGRALMWKNRDTSVLDNKVVFVQGEKYAFLALINASDNKVVNAWAGINSHGFAIMNSASGDLAENVKGINQNGRLMKEALGKCTDGAQTFKLNDLARSLASFVYTSLQTSFPDLKDQD